PGREGYGPDPDRCDASVEGLRTSASARSIPTHADVTARAKMARTATTPMPAATAIATIARRTPHVMSASSARCLATLGDTRRLELTTAGPSGGRRQRNRVHPAPGSVRAGGSFPEAGCSEIRRLDCGRR